MIFGIGCDIAKVSRFDKWVQEPNMINRFFNEKEVLQSEGAKNRRLSEWYAVRFAAKEAFSKALGTGLRDFSLADIYIEKDVLGKPFLRVTGKAKEKMESLCGLDTKVHVSLSHEKDYAVAFVIIEKRG